MHTRLAFALLFFVAACGADDASPGGDTADAATNGDVGQSDAENDAFMAEDAGGEGVTAEATCPPEGPYGTSTGDILPNLTLTTCDGDAVELHSVCERDATLLIGFAEWCTRCARRAPELQVLYEELQADGANVEAMIVVTEDSSFRAADADTCSRIRERYGFTMPVVFASGDEFESVLMQRPNDSSVVLERGVRVVSSGQNVTTPTLDASLRGLLD